LTITVTGLPATGPPETFRKALSYTLGDRLPIDKAVLITVWPSIGRLIGCLPAAR